MADIDASAASVKSWRMRPGREGNPRRENTEKGGGERQHRLKTAQDMQSISFDMHASKPQFNKIDKN